MAMKPIIVVPAYNRASALKRLLNSIDSAEYIVRPDLLISLEGGASQEVVSVAKEFISEKLNVRVLQRPTRLGLRRHVIACADLVYDYESVIILEDDLIVDRYFYLYASQALDFYSQEDLIAGIALYGYEYNEFAGLPFRPMANGYSTYPMQVVCSWGQCWTRSQWNGFKAWYTEKDSTNLEKINGLPDEVKTWSESSWKKYFQGYMIETSKIFIYPYLSFSTNCSDAVGGTHVSKHLKNIQQVCLPTPERPHPIINFCPAENREVAYDAYMEPSGNFVYRTLGMTDDNVTLDLQGIKPLSYLKKWKYAVSLRQASETLASYDFDFRPPEINLMFPQHNKNCVWRLARTTSLKATNNIKLSLSGINAYTGMELMCKGVVLVILRQLPQVLFQKLFRIIKKALSS